MSLNIIPTRAALAKQKNLDFKAIVFEEPKFTKNEKPFDDKSEKQYSDSDDEFDDFNDPSEEIKRKKPKDNTEFDMKSARHEIMKFANDGIKRFKNKKKTEINLMVKLGAKPPKRSHRNYKELLAERKRNQEIQEKRQKLRQLGKRANGNCSVKCNSKNRSKIIVDGISKHYGVANPKIKKKK